VSVFGADEELLNRGSVHKTFDENETRTETPTEKKAETVLETATSFKKMPVMARFVGGTEDKDWVQRGEATLGYTYTGSLHSVEVSNRELGTVEAENLQI